MSATLTRPTTQSVFEFNRDQFREKFPHQGFLTPHRLCGHPLLELPRLEKLARTLPEALVEYHSGKVGFSQPKKTYPGNGLSMLDTIRRIEETTSWMVLRQCEHDPEYAELMHSLIGEVLAQFAGLPPQPWMQEIHRQHVFIFISSPNTITPCHVDDEHSFLMQVRGSKTVAQWDWRDRRIMTEPQAEDMLEFWHDEKYDCYLPYKDEFLPAATQFELQAGNALHFPFGAPHWVKNGPAVSISFSIAWRSLMSEQHAVVYHLNKRMRALGLKPTPPEQSAWRDSVKFNAFMAARQTARLARGVRKERWA
jgi:hypothetical protein